MIGKINNLKNNINLSSEIKYKSNFKKTKPNEKKF